MEAVKVLAEAIFILSLALAAYTYAGYPVALFALSRLLGRDVRKRDITPAVSVIIAAYNEEADIREKLEITVASDCSSDRTDEIVRGFADRGVILHRRPERLGKTSAQNHAVGVSTGEVLL